jgi:hypothetical protein
MVVRLTAYSWTRLSSEGRRLPAGRIHAFPDTSAALPADQSLENLREQQASALAYFDAFLIFTVVAVVLAFWFP